MNYSSSLTGGFSPTRPGGYNASVSTPALFDFGYRPNPNGKLSRRGQLLLLFLINSLLLSNLLPIGSYQFSAGFDATMPLPTPSNYPPAPKLLPNTPVVGSAGSLISSLPPAGISGLRSSIEGYGVQANWTTDRPYNFVVEYGTTPALGQTADNQFLKSEKLADGSLVHSLRLPTLDKVQYYQLKAVEPATGIIAYTTEVQSLAPPPGSGSDSSSLGALNLNYSGVQAAPASSATRPTRYTRKATSLFLPPPSATVASGVIVGGPTSQLESGHCYKVSGLSLSARQSGPPTPFYIVGNYMDSPYGTSFHLGPSPYDPNNPGAERIAWFGSLGAVILPGGGTISGGIGEYKRSGFSVTAVDEIPGVDMATHPRAIAYGWYCNKKTPPVKKDPECFKQCPRDIKVGDPVNLEMGGAYEETLPLLGISDGAAGPGIDVQARYSSAMFAAGLGSTRLGKGWMLTYDRYMVYEPLPAYPITSTDTPRWALYDEAGHRYTYTRSGTGTGFASESNNYTTLTENIEAGELVLQYVDKTRDIFDAQTGRLKAMQDRFGNGLVFTWTTDTTVTPNLQVQKITHNRTGQSLYLKHQLRYDPDSDTEVWRLVSIEDDVSRGAEARKVTLGYGNSNGNGAANTGNDRDRDRLVTLTDVGGGVKTFGYDAKGRIARYYDEHNNPAVLGNAARATVNTYDDPVYSIPAPVITTIAGTGVAGGTGDGGDATAAQLNNVQGFAYDSTGNLYISDSGNHRVRKISPNGVITTVVGTGVAGATGDGGSALAAQLNTPTGLAFDNAGNLYIADYGNHKIRKVTPAGVISTLAGTGVAGATGDGALAGSAQLNNPTGVTFDAAQNLYIADYGNHKIRKVTPAGVISTLAGTGVAGATGDGAAATTAQLNSPRKLLFDAAGSLYIADQQNHKIRKISSSGVITTVVGTGVAGFGGDGGVATSAQLNSPSDVVVDKAGNLYIADRQNNRVRKVATGAGAGADGRISTVAGTTASTFAGDGDIANGAGVGPSDLIFDETGSNLFIGDMANQRLRKVDLYRTSLGQRVSKQVLANGVTIDFVWQQVTTPRFYHLEVIYNKGQADERRMRYTMQNGVTPSTAVGAAASYNRIVQAFMPNSLDAWTSYSYTPNGQLQSVSGYPSGPTTSYTYDTLTGNASQIQEGSSITKFVYDTFGNVTRLTDPMNNVTSWTYDANGLLQSMSRSATLNSTIITQTTTYTHNSFGQATGMTLPDGVQTTQSYDAQSYPTIFTMDSAPGGLGITSSTNYDWRGWLSTSTDERGVVTNYEYYPQGWLKALVADAAASGGRQVRTELYYDIKGNLTKSVKDAGSGRLNITTNYSYVQVGTEGGYAPATITNPLSQTTRLTYNSYGDVKTATDPLNRTTTYDYTPQGWLKTVTLPDGRVALTNTYNPAGQLVKDTDPRGFTREYTYDDKWRLSKLSEGTAAIEGSPSVSATTTYYYDNNDRISFINKGGYPGGGYTLYQATYDGFNRLVSEQDALARRTTYSYDNRTNLVNLVTYGSNNTQQQTQVGYTYDKLGRLLSETQDPCPTPGCTDRLNLTSRYSYTLPGSGSTDLWSLQQITDPNGNRTQYAYNSLGLVERVTDPRNENWVYNYNNLGWLTDYVDARERTNGTGRTSYTYDLLGRPKSLSRGGLTESWNYNADDTLDSHIAFNGVVTKYTYDTTGRVERVDYSKPGTAVGQPGYIDPNSPTYPGASFTYHPNDLLKTVTDKSGVTTYQYDANNRLVSRSRPAGTGTLTPEVKYAYDALERLSKLTYWDKGDVNLSYNQGDSLIGRVDAAWGQATGSYQPTNYDYRSTGQLNSKVTGSQYTYGGYDTAARLGRLTERATGTPANVQKDILYPNRDANGNALTQKDANGTTRYTYDQFDRLTQVVYPPIEGGQGLPGQVLDYRYARVGNRTYAASPTTPRELLTNPSFEANYRGAVAVETPNPTSTDTATTGWTVSVNTSASGIATETVQTFRGATALRLTGGAVAQPVVVSQTVSGLTPSTHYLFTAWVKRPTADGGSAYLFANNTGVAEVRADVGATVSPSYQPVSLILATGPSATSVSVGVAKTEGTGSLYLDNLNLIALPIKNGSFDATPDLLGWTSSDISSTVVVTNTNPTGNVLEGVKALRITGSSKTISQQIQVKPNTTYRLTAWGKLGAGAGAGAGAAESGNIFVRGFDSQNQQTPPQGEHRASFSAASATDGYEYVSLSFTTGANDTLATIGATKTGGAGSMYLDSFSLVETWLPNPDFEAGNSRWNLSAASSVISGANTAYNGERALRIGGNDAGAWQTLQGLEPNTNYILTAYAKVSSPNTTLSVFVRDYGYPETRADVTAVASGTNNSSTSGRNGYKQFVLPFTTGMNNTSATIGAWLLGGGGEGFVDGFELEKGQQPFDINDRLTGPGFVYDTNGNLVRDENANTYEYDAANRLIKSVRGSDSAITEYRYDGLGNLVKVIHNGVTTHLVLDESGELTRILGEINEGANTDQTLYAYGADGLASLKKFAGGTAAGGQPNLYPLVDELGTIRHLTDGTGTVKASFSYDAWGNLRHKSGAEQNTSSLGYTGERMNPDGTVYLRARMYQPMLGRFLQRDTLDTAFVGQGTQGHNRYAYVENNPVNMTDPTGHVPARPQARPQSKPRPAMTEAQKLAADDAERQLRNAIRDYNRAVDEFTGRSARETGLKAGLDEAAIGATGGALACGLEPSRLCLITTIGGAALGGLTGGALAGADERKAKREAYSKIQRLRDTYYEALKKARDSRVNPDRLKFILPELKPCPPEPYPDGGLRRPLRNGFREFPKK
jgi:RHS repeat-associated protein